LRVRHKAVVFVFRIAVALGVVLLFWVPAWRLLAASGQSSMPLPLDDVYIYFDFARSTARGCVLCYTEEGGFSSGATSPPYALVLALGWAVGFRERALAVFAAVVAVLSLVDLFASASEIAPRPRVLAFLVPLVLVGIPVLSWSWVSGMETAFVAMIAGRALVSVSRTWRAPPDQRPRAQLRAGVFIALLGWARPECVPLALLLAVAVGHGAGTTPLFASLARALGPLAALGGIWALIVRRATGEWAAAGAIRKLATSDPYGTSIDVAGVWLKNLLRLGTEGVEIALGGGLGALATVGLAFMGLTHRETRRVSAALLVGATSALALVCVNTTAPFQNLRYATPTLFLILLAAIVGVYASSLRHRTMGLAGALVLALAVAGAARAFPKQIDHYARASRNIAEQQVEVGRRLRELGAKRVFVGDAGAIRYISDLPVIDGLGLGGYRDLPFARASVHGIPCVIELIARLPHDERPDVLAIYDSWWPGVGERFGHRWFSVKIDDNVICGADEKVVYRADWRLLEDRGEPFATVLDRIDVGDLVDERNHRLEFTRPRGGYVVEAVRLDERGIERWDAGRLLAAGQELSFDLVLAADAEHPTLVVMSDERISLVASMGGDSIPLEGTPGEAAGRWLAARARLGKAKKGDRVRLVAGRSARIFSILLLP
jgi:hypothetical protein